ncbi:hypothetical protein AMATHDRAFT_1004 [Amanita thiersii Skay4041]|uniref:FAD-binding domain-containing protein n=1 Tax=Amanita thiersii Skay4041 TaxID=703135 RepID=A0A2A9NWH8_9AGAR|nr:hypothetical protein AMATHDRAFT_1004 [Amanita thiersii Skay4041]
MSPPCTSCVLPKHTQILIIGGGPAGSYAAAALAREGLNVTLFEASKFPRYHVGESLIPSIRHYLRFIGAEEKLVKHGFIRKPGSAIKFNQYKREGYTDFVALGHNNNAWNVVRSEFDQMLLNHARSCGANVYERTKVGSIAFSAVDPTKPVSVSWTHTPPPTPPSPPSSPLHSPIKSCTRLGDDTILPVTGITTFDYLIDATGRRGIMSTQYLKNRYFNVSLKNIAVWGYWTDVGLYGVGTSREGAPWFEALTDESGWAWCIPLHDGTTSIGVVMNQEIYNSSQNPLHVPPFMSLSISDFSDSTMASRYLSHLAFAPGLVRLVNPHGRLISGSVRSASDFSYSAPSYAGSNYRIIGDAAAFIDPFFSSGIHLALTSALSAASSVCASIRGHCSEACASQWHTKRVATSYTRFQVVVLSAYKQIRAQNVNVLSDISEDNYDRAFAFLRPGGSTQQLLFSYICAWVLSSDGSRHAPVIQGASDMGTRLSESELQKSLDFCVNLFNPTSPEQHDRLSRSGMLGKVLLDVTAPVMDPVTLESTLQVTRKAATATMTAANNNDNNNDNSCRLVVGQEPREASYPGDSEQASEMDMVLKKINARRVVHSEYAINNLELEPLEGYVVLLEKGKLGLRPVNASS